MLPPLSHPIGFSDSRFEVINNETTVIDSRFFHAPGTFLRRLGVTHATRENASHVTVGKILQWAPTAVGVRCCHAADTYISQLPTSERPKPDRWGADWMYEHLKDINFVFDHTLLTIVLVDWYSSFDKVCEGYRIGQVIIGDEIGDDLDMDMHGLDAAKFAEMKQLPYVTFTPAHLLGINLFTAVVDRDHADFPRRLL
jgi:hypothetical protein